MIRLCELPAERDAIASLEGYRAAAHRLLSVVKSKYTHDEWEKTFGPIRDRLNERERDALAALLLREKKLETLQDLSAYLLIDVEMGGCAKTSYVKEAIGCVQTYIERCRMHLEDGVTLTSEQLPDSEWAWMGNYRMWEANRRVFFYPENYLEPSQRKQATPLVQGTAKRSCRRVTSPTKPWKPPTSTTSTSSTSWPASRSLTATSPR